MAKLILVRHGKTEGNKKGVYTGWTNTMLSEEGIKELELFKDKYNYQKTDRYYTSDLQRAIDTFNILYPEESIHESTKAFREVHFGIKENKPAIRESENAYFRALLTNNDRLQGETISQVGLRIFGKLTAILREMEHSNEDSVTIVCHAGVLRVVLSFLKPIPFDYYYDIDVRNGLGYILDLEFDSKNNLITLKDTAKIEDF